MKSVILLLSSFSLVSTILMGKNKQYPNFVWIMAEDVAPHFMGLYNGGKGAQTPNLEKLAQEGIIFNNAYSNAPVSSAARSTLITGCYAPRLGISFHRKLELVPLPETLRMFPAYLRQAGYHTSNAAKTDYNCFLDSTAWDVVNGKLGEWRNRKDKTQPFFFVRTNAASHESCLHFSREDFEDRKTHHRLSEVSVLPIHPDTELFRYTYARFYDHIQEVDTELGNIMSMLEADGELDDTFIFYFGDNGGSLPGSKGYTYETGLKVPLVVYIPKNWRNKIPLPINSSANGFVSFMDFAPTLLHLAGIEIPKEMDGRPFLGKEISVDVLDSREEVYCYGDRFDELYAFNRTIRKGNFKYSRNFQPYHPKSLYSTYRYKQLAFRQWKDLYLASSLNDVQSRFFEPQGPEELYDLVSDPYETKNLAGDIRYSSVLFEMRKLLCNNMIANNDLGMFPESVWLAEGKKSPVDYGVNMHDRIIGLLEKADLQLYPFEEVYMKLSQSLNSDDSVERYWALTACAYFGEKAKVLADQIHFVLRNDTNAYVRSRALIAASRFEAVDFSIIQSFLKNSRSEAELLQVLNDAAYLKECNSNYRFGIVAEELPFVSENIRWRLDYLNGK